LEMSS